MPQGGQLTFTTQAVDGRVEVSCRDSGEGISQEVKERIFDPLFTTKLGGRGAGLGLTIVHQIVREHGGTVTVESAPGEGAEFRLSLLLVEREETSEQNQTAGHENIAV
jgi:signal transduction histidine kinase